MAYEIYVQEAEDVMIRREVHEIRNRANYAARKYRKDGKRAVVLRVPEPPPPEVAAAA